MSKDDFTCLFCLAPVAAEHFCFGCGATICEACNADPLVGGDHEPDDHRRTIVKCTGFDLPVCWECGAAMLTYFDPKGGERYECFCGAVRHG